jgi:hypothetical protein
MWKLVGITLFCLLASLYFLGICLVTWYEGYLPWHSDYVQKMRYRGLEEGSALVEQIGLFIAVMLAAQGLLMGWLAYAGMKQLIGNLL